MKVPKWKLTCALGSCEGAVGGLESGRTKTTLISAGRRASCTVGIERVALRELRGAGLNPGKPGQGQASASLIPVLVSDKP